MEEIQQQAQEALDNLGAATDAAPLVHVRENLTRIKEIADQELERMRVEDEIDSALNPNEGDS